MNADEIKYKHFSITHNLKAPSVVVKLINQLFSPTSVVDVGCGLGTWLKIFQQEGVKDILGLDGNNVNPGELHIDPAFFKAIDFRKNIELSRRFDIVLCLEVAEHLGEEHADQFVDLLISLGDMIIFSAAIPGQGGQNHLNEQLPSYWVHKFKQRGFLHFDLIRPHIWDNPDVDYWYKQNMLVFSRKELSFQGNKEYTDLVHPELLSMKNKELSELYRKIDNPGLKNSFRNIVKALIR